MEEFMILTRSLRKEKPLDRNLQKIYDDLLPVMSLRSLDNKIARMLHSCHDVDFFRSVVNAGILGGGRANSIGLNIIKGLKLRYRKEFTRHKACLQQGLPLYGYRAPWNFGQDAGDLHPRQLDFFAGTRKIPPHVTFVPTWAYNVDIKEDRPHFREFWNMSGLLLVSLIDAMSSNSLLLRMTFQHLGYPLLPLLLHLLGGGELLHLQLRAALSASNNGNLMQ
ncbi:uncharacterized protein LOC118439479 isoform X2 [Folsomia candida]|uniref:uncharacterized protein LOC118439479 isoform X2 n=1 Tax=Folsomia candida TaxID=158441 RepID=UPI001605026B|nr:uncharacterized protein LOC118439479 isoform X2 [Folsomia candida]